MNAPQERRTRSSCYVPTGAADSITTSIPSTVPTSFHKPIVSGHLCNLGLLLPKGNHALGLLDNRVQLYFLLVVVFNHTIGIFHWPGRCIYLRTIVNGRGCGDQRLFSTIVEIFLYCVALNQAKGKLVEGSMIGSILGAVLLLPGLSMCGVHSNGKLRDTTRDLLVSPQQCYCMPWW